MNAAKQPAHAQPRSAGSSSADAGAKAAILLAALGIVLGNPLLVISAVAIGLVSSASSAFCDDTPGRIPY